MMACTLSHSWDKRENWCCAFPARRWQPGPRTMLLLRQQFWWGIYVIFLHLLQAVWLWCSYCLTGGYFDLAAPGQLKGYNFCRRVFPRVTNSHFKPKPGVSQGYGEAEEISEVYERSVGNQCKQGEVLAGGIAADDCFRRPAMQSVGLWGWWGDWSISPMRKGWGSWPCSAWRREGWEGTLKMPTNISRVGVKMTGPDSFQWCTVTGQGAMGTNWSIESSVWTWGRTSSLWGWRSTGTGCRRGCGLSFSGDFQHPLQRGPVQPAVGDPALAEGLD